MKTFYMRRERYFLHHLLSSIYYSSNENTHATARRGARKIMVSLMLAKRRYRHQSTRGRLHASIMAEI